MSLNTGLQKPPSFMIRGFGFFKVSLVYGRAFSIWLVVGVCLSSVVNGLL